MVDVGGLAMFGAAPEQVVLVCVRKEAKQAS